MPNHHRKERLNVLDPGKNGNLLCVVGRRSGSRHACGLERHSNHTDLIILPPRLDKPLCTTPKLLHELCLDILFVHIPAVRVRAGLPPLDNVLAIPNNCMTLSLIVRILAQLNERNGEILPNLFAGGKDCGVVLGIVTPAQGRVGGMHSENLGHYLFSFKPSFNFFQ